MSFHNSNFVVETDWYFSTILPHTFLYYFNFCCDGNIFKLSCWHRKKCFNILDEKIFKSKMSNPITLYNQISVLNIAHLKSSLDIQYFAHAGNAMGEILLRSLHMSRNCICHGQRGNIILPDICGNCLWKLKWFNFRQRCDVTNSNRVFTPGERKALAKFKVHQCLPAWDTVYCGWSS
jgi:hypothetical protein